MSEIITSAPLCTFMTWTGKNFPITSFSLCVGNDENRDKHKPG